MKYAALILVALAAAVPFRSAASGATFVAATANPAASFGTAADFNTVAVSLTDPGTNLRGSVALAATAASDRGIAGVKLQVSAAGANTWTDACSAAVAPYACTFDTTTVADGLKDIRALATDSAGYTRTAAVTSRRIDNTGPATTLTDPGTPLTATKALTATAADTGSGLASVKLQYKAPAASTWTDICAAASCSLNTATLADGLYDLRSLATDVAGNTSSSVVSSRRIDNTAPTAAVSGLAAYVRGTVALAATTGDGSGAGVASVRYQTRPNGGATWTDACTAATTPFSCSLATTTLTDGLYDVHAIATDGAGFATTSATLTTRVDNAAPSSAVLTNPGTPLSGTVALAATAADAGSGVASVQFQSAPTGTSTWTTLCTDTTSAYSCSWNTTTMADAVYDLRAVATDNAGNTLNSTTLTGKRVDNNGPTVTVTDPGAAIHGAVTIAATAADPAGVASVVIQRKPTTGSTWTTICTDTTSSYSCAWTTTGVTDGSYDLRATATDSVSHATTSATITTRVDNTAPTGTDVQAVNGTGVAKQVDAGDIITFTYSEAMAPASILAGWTGAATTVSVRVTNSGTSDTLSIYDSANATRLNLISSTTDVALKADRTAAGAQFTATMTMSGSQVTVTLGAVVSGSTKGVASTTTAMVWTPSATATDLAGNAGSATAVTESGTADVDF